jgi:hypothetical protein
MNRIEKIFFAGAIFAITFSSRAANAATLSFTSGATSTSIGSTIDVSVRINSQGQTVNAAQGTLQYPSSILQVVHVDHSNSIFNIWAQEPTISTSTGEISFLGGSTNSFSGTSLYVLDVTFLVRGTGMATLNFANAGVTAGDGTGANILDGTNPLSININGAAGSLPVTATTPAGTAPSSTAVAPAPVTRTAVAATGLPSAPVLQVPLYPDQTRWYNQLGEVFMFWNLPSDVVQVATRVSHAPDTVAGQKQSQLLTGQSFGTLSDGVWYLRAQFINNVGLGSPAYYKISIDTTPPLPFQAQIDNATSDNPTPRIQYGTSDSLSGIDHYEVAVDGEKAIVTTSTSMFLPPQAPGTHLLVVSAVDLAGNATKSSLVFTILPLASPRIIFATPSAPQGEPLFISGTALPQNTVSVNVLDSKQQSVFMGTTTADNAGNWGMTVNQDIAAGTYGASVTASDARGATSLPVKSKSIIVRDRVIFSIGPLNFDWFELFLVIVLIAIAAAAIFAWLLSRRAERRQAFRTIAERDVIKSIDVLSSQLEEAHKRFEGMNGQGSVETSKTELGQFLEKARDTAAKMKRYLGDEIGEIK